jgi:hypothetical protein
VRGPLCCWCRQATGRRSSRCTSKCAVIRAIENGVPMVCAARWRLVGCRGRLLSRVDPFVDGGKPWLRKSARGMSPRSTLQPGIGPGGVVSLRSSPWWRAGCDFGSSENATPARPAPTQSDRLGRSATRSERRDWCREDGGW